ncbi:AraC family transcriptional regulator [Leifsonia sp. Le1]|uniref:AraC family transcriptional regulator n=1 Tax=Leifsonia sp. Le1 TaxID=3404918 RepID=UPI003EBDBFF8
MTETPIHSFVTNDVDESIAIGSRLFNDHRVRPVHAHAAFSYSLTAARVGTIAFGRLRYGCEVSVDVAGTEDSYAVSVPSTGTIRFHGRGADAESTPELATIGGPVDRVSLSGWAADDESLAMIWFNRRALEADLGRLLGIDAPALIAFPRLLDLRDGRGAEWYAYATTMIDSVGRSGALAVNPLLASQVSSILSTGLLLAAEHQYRSALDAPPAPQAPATVRRAMHFIEDNVREPITVPDIAASVGSSVRALNRGFKEHLGTSPLAYLTRVRMEGAHRELLSGAPEDTSVSQIATSWGFYHFGRFAARYRELHGISPSEALRSSNPRR